VGVVCLKQLHLEELPDGQLLKTVIRAVGAVRVSKTYCTLQDDVDGYAGLRQDRITRTAAGVILSANSDLFNKAQRTIR